MNEDKYLPYASLFLRLALAFTLLSGVADRFGFWGEPGANHVVWGDWFKFETYTHTLFPFLSRGISDKLALAITLMEIVFSVMLLFGIKIKWAAIGTGVLLLILAISMTLAFGLKTPLDYFMFIGSAASFVLAAIPIYKWTMNGIKKRTVYKPY